MPNDEGRHRPQAPGGERESTEGIANTVHGRRAGRLTIAALAAAAALLVAGCQSGTPTATQLNPQAVAGKSATTVAKYLKIFPAPGAKDVNPAAGITVFDNVSPTAVVYYLAGTTGWGPVYSFLPTELLNPISGIGLNNNQFGFTISGTNSQVITVEASTNLTNPNWQPLETNTLNGSSFHFTDPQWGNYPRRFYRVVFLP